MGETLNAHFCRKINDLGVWALKDHRNFGDFVWGSVYIFESYYELLSFLLDFWREEQFKSVGINKLVFRVSLVWEAFSNQIRLIRDVFQCKFGVY